MFEKNGTLQKEREGMIFSTGSRKSTMRRAAAAVEFAAVAPIFITLVLGIVECGRMIMVQEILVNAAREGARASTLPGATDPPIDTTVENYLTNAGITASNCTIILTPAESTNPGIGTPMYSTVSVPCADVSWLSTTSPYFSGMTLSATVVMLHQ
jgi:Flp pilus assembly protein TadG